MAEFLIAMADLGDPADAWRYARAWKRGDILWVASDGQEWGREEDYERFLAAGNRPADWHSRLAVVRLPGVALDAARSYRVAGPNGENGRFRFDLSRLERRNPATRSDTIFTQFRIQREAAEGLACIVDKAG